MTDVAQLARWTQHGSDCARAASTAYPCSCGLQQAWDTVLGSSEGACEVERLENAIAAYFSGRYPMGVIASRADAEQALKDAAGRALDRVKEGSSSVAHPQAHLPPAIDPRTPRDPAWHH